MGARDELLLRRRLDQLREAALGREVLRQLGAALAREADSLNDPLARFRLAEVAVTASTGFRSSRSLGTAEHSAPPSASRKTAGAAVAPLARPSSSRTAAAASPHGGSTCRNGRATPFCSHS